MRAGFACAGILLLAGCGGEESFQIVPVSGVVTLDDEPLADATVTFVPQGEAGANTGPAASGKTDAEGAFTMKTAGGETGAVAGQNRVMITTLNDDTGDPSSDEMDYTIEERVPARYNTNSELTFDVPVEGTDEANFKLESE